MLYQRGRVSTRPTLPHAEARRTHTKTTNDRETGIYLYLQKTLDDVIVGVSCSAEQRSSPYINTTSDCHQNERTIGGVAHAEGGFGGSIPAERKKFFQYENYIPSACPFLLAYLVSKQAAREAYAYQCWPPMTKLKSNTTKTRTAQSVRASKTRCR